MQSADHLNENIIAYLAGELNEREKRDAEAHLAKCADCRAELERQRHLSDVLSQDGPLEVSPEFARAVLGRVEAERKVMRFRKRRNLALLAFAAAIVFVVLLLRVFAPVRTPAPIVETPRRVITRPQPPTLQPPAPQPAARGPEQLNQEDIELVANLEAVENMDLLKEYDNVDNLELAVVGSGEETVQ